uniref:Reverse transcriptase Ty1/copia-type domain-containing protein n=1 Tax=Cannabis sativa TaxID=3483 RepID=A0A803PHA8_CANSA
METILTASIAILVILCLAALLNNAFNVTNLLGIHPIFGSQSSKIYSLKYGSSSLFLSASFLFGSMAIGSLIDANFMVNNVSSEFSNSSLNVTNTVFEKGFVLALVSNRMLCISFPFMLWMLGPLPVLLSSMALVWCLYQLDFVAKFTNHAKSNHSLFVQVTASSYQYILVYVDDILIIGSNSDQVSSLIASLSFPFALKDLGILSFFLGIQVCPTTKGVILSQQKYLQDLICKAELQGVRPQSTPINNGLH